VQVKAKIELMDSFSAHGDREEMKAFLQNQKTKAKTIFLVHGDYKTQKSWKTTLMEDGFRKVDIPGLGDIASLG
jgi:metallo-beta-lactamase family protein